MQRDFLQLGSAAPVAFGRRPCPFPRPPRRLPSSAAVVPGLFFEASNKYAFTGKMVSFPSFSHVQKQVDYF